MTTGPHLSSSSPSLSFLPFACLSAILVSSPPSSLPSPQFNSFNLPPSSLLLFNFLPLSLPSISSSLCLSSFPLSVSLSICLSLSSTFPLSSTHHCRLHSVNGCGRVPERFADHILVGDAVVGQGLAPHGVERVVQGLGPKFVGLEDKRRRFVLQD